MKIYTKFGKQRTVREFLKKLFSSEHMGGYLLNTYTFFDENCTRIQCEKNKFRSFDDVFDCVATYYKGVTPKMLIHILLTLDLKNSKGQQLYLHMSNCSTIRRIRMLYYFNEQQSYSGYVCSKMDSKYSWEELLALLGIRSRQEIIDYYNKYQKIKYETV